eukprot:SAG31_NODE_40558_length_280_cov_0.574586_1_plen_52_part_10
MTLAAALDPRARFNQAAISQHIGDFEVAEAIYSELAAEQAERLGPEHPDTRK